MRGARVGLALSQPKQSLKRLAILHLPLEPPDKPDRKKELALDWLDKSEYLQMHMPIFEGPDQNKLWVEETDFSWA